MASDKKDGYQVTKENLSLAIANDKTCSVQDVIIKDFSMKGGSRAGENFTCVLFAVDIEATVKGEPEKLNYMAKCLPSNPFRAKFLTEINGFERECYVYNELLKKYQQIRDEQGLEPLAVPKVFLADMTKELIVMENLKTQNFTMLNRLDGEVITLPTAEKVMRAIASFHASGYHFLQTHPGGAEDFLAKRPDFSFRGWISPAGESESRRRFNFTITTFVQVLVNVFKHLAESEEDKALIQRLDAFTKTMLDKLDDKTYFVEDGFNVLNHNDLHMNNVMYTKKEDGSADKLVLLDLQLMKYTRPTVDLAYFFGSSTSAAFRSQHLDHLLQVYHDQLGEELLIFGYSIKSLYPLDKLKEDFQDTWHFGFVVASLHMQILNMHAPGSGEAKPEFDPGEIKDAEMHKKVMAIMLKKSFERGIKNPKFVDFAFSMVREAAERNVI